MQELHHYRFEELKVGQKGSLKHTLTEEELQTFITLTGDRNPLHVDPEFAVQTTFRKPVVHGMLTSSFISTLIGMILPGKGALWISQTFEFLQPAFVGDEISVDGVIVQKSDSTKIIVLDVTIKNQHGQVLVQGKSHVRLLVAEQDEKINSSIASIQVDKKSESVPFCSSNHQTVLVTGGSRGIGAATVKKLASLGFHVAFTFNRGEQEAKELEKQFQDAKTKVRGFKADLSQTSEVWSLMGVLDKEFPPLNAFVHCAASPAVPAPLETVGWEALEEQMHTQLRAGFYISQKLLPRMREQKSGNLIFIGSIYTDNVPPIQQLPYVVTKGALTYLMRSLAVECGPHGIRVNMVSPGMTKTDMIANLPEKTKLLAQMQTPLRKLAEPEAIADTVAFLLSSSGGHITGENIRVCGGVVMA